MRQFELKRTLSGADITAQVTVLDKGVHILICGGTQPHIGAVSVVDPAGICATTQFPGHKDGIVSEQWAKALSEAGYCPAAVIAGIHYDKISKDQICTVLELNNQLICSAIAELRGARKEAFL